MQSAPICSRLVPLLCAVPVFLTSNAASAAGTQSLQLHPEHPHYFLWRGQPTVLITSGEHYGAVLNLEFDYHQYLKMLAADKLNLTRTFTGAAYYEPHGAFNIARNTLAPSPDKFICPWAKAEASSKSIRNKYDLSRWDDAYFARLHDFVVKASGAGVVVELNLFCPFYEEAQWQLSPFHAANNVNNVGAVARTNVYTLDRNGGLLPYQETVVRKLVQELESADNVYYEICNEPYFGGVTLEWQHHIADVINEAQKMHAPKKLISQNIANKSAKIVNAHPAVSIFNFHYATPPEAVTINYELNKVIGDNETGFRGTNNLPYRSEAWEFLLAGGGLYNNLDYSFTAGHERGDFTYPGSQPGGGNPTLRKELRILRDFIYSFDFIHMKSDRSWIQGSSPRDLSLWALAAPGNAYAVYLRAPKSQAASGASLEINLAEGSYQAEWIDTGSGDVVKEETFVRSSERQTLNAPGFKEDIALRIRVRR